MSRATRVPLLRGHIDRVRREAVLDGRRTPLSPTEIALLDYLDGREGKTATRAELLRDVWGYSERVVSRTLDTTVARLRAKIELNPATPRHLLTVPGVGYRLEPLAFPSSAVGGPGPLVGREAEIAELERALSQGLRLVTICGVGGMGKTRVLRAWAERHGAPLVEMGPLSSLDELREAIARALGVAARSDWRELGEAAAARSPALLALDQAEALVADLGVPLLELLGGGHEVRLILSSRVPSRVPGERLVVLGPLPPADARQLYDLRRGGVDEPRVDELLARLGHIPLAVELAAARSHTLSAAEQIRSLGLDLLEVEDPDGPSVRRSIAGSWDLLDEQAREGLRALCVFRDAFTYDAARAVLGGARAQANATLEALRGSALLMVAPGAAGRLCVLEPIRWFALERRPGDDGAALRHARWCARWGALARLRALDRDRGELRHALVADFPEILAAIPVVLAADEPELTADLWMGFFELNRMDGRGCVELTRLGARLVEDGRLERTTEILVRLRHADVLRRQGRLHDALALARAALPRATELGDDEILAFAEHSLAVMVLDLGAADEARELGLRALGSARRAGVADLEAAAQTALASAAEVLERHEPWREHLMAAVDLYRAIGNRRAEAIVLGSLGNLMHSLGQLDAADQAWQAALDLHTELGDRRHGAMIAANRSLIQRARGQVDEAEAVLRAALEVHRRAQTRRFEASALALLADLLRARGELVEALLLARDALRLADAIAWPAMRHGVQGLLGELEVSLGDPTGQSRIERAIETLREAGYDAEARSVLCRRGRVLLQNGDLDGARATLAEIESGDTRNGEVALALDEFRAMLAATS